MKFYATLRSFLGPLGKFEVTFVYVDGVVRFFVSANSDLGTISNSLSGMLLRPVGDEDVVHVPKTQAREHFMPFVSGGNILDFKEKVAVKKSKVLQYAVFSVRIINANRALVKTTLYFKNPDGHYSKTAHVTHFFPAQLLAVNFTDNAQYLKHTAPKYLDIEKSLFMLSSGSESAVFSVEAFPYFSHNYYLNLTDYEFDKHSFIIGASGSGKSKFISLYIDRLHQTAMKMNYRVVVIDPHASLAADVGHVPDSKIVNFTSESTELFAGAAADISAATELTSTLFKSIMGETYNPKVDRLLRFTLFVLFTAQTMSLGTVKRFLSEVDLRNQIIEHVSGYIPTNIVQFFGADFNEMRTKYYNESISPLISLIDEMQLQPVLVGEGEVSLTKTIQDNFLTVFSLNKVSMGERVVKTVAGLLIQQIFLLAQARAFREKIILIIDEVSVVQNPALSSILAEARKFNLSVVLTQQYFGQIEKDLQDAIFANVLNYYVFKVSEEDARNLEGNLNMVLPKNSAHSEHTKGLKESEVRVKMMTELHPRECIARVSANGQIIPAIKARTVDAPAQLYKSKEHLEKRLNTVSNLPAKFKEVSSTEPVASSSPMGITRVLAKKAHRTVPIPHTILLPNGLDAVEPFMGKQLADKSAGLFNLSELLAQHSSSRLQVKKQKD